MIRHKPNEKSSYTYLLAIQINYLVIHVTYAAVFYENN